MTSPRSKGTTELIYRLVQRSRFPLVRDLEAMEGLIGVLRIGVAAVALVRTLLIVDASRFYFDAGPGITGWFVNVQTEWAIFECVLLVLVMLGVATPLAILTLAVTYPAMEAALGIQTLGTDVLALLLVFLLLANSGARRSVDASLAYRIAPIRWLHNLSGRPDARQLTVYLFGLFAAYAVVSFRALLFHLQDTYWQTGQTVGFMFTNAFLSRVWEPARALELAWPRAFGALSAIAVLGQSVFQGLMLPLAFTRTGMLYVMTWGVLFIALSLVLLQLSYLPFFEAFLWVAVFARPTGPRMRGRNCVATRQRPYLASDSAVAVLAVLAAAFVAQVPGLGAAFDTVGFDAPNVFNRTDLRMGEQWWTATRIATGEDVPMYGPSGIRRRYHSSDILYVGNSLRWRRAMIDRNLEEANAPGAFGGHYITAVLRYDRRRHTGTEPWEYDLRLFRDRSARFEVSFDERYHVRQVGGFRVTIAP